MTKQINRSIVLKPRSLCPRFFAMLSDKQQPGTICLSFALFLTERAYKALAATRETDEANILRLTLCHEFEMILYICTYL